MDYNTAIDLNDIEVCFELVILQQQMMNFLVPGCVTQLLVIHLIQVELIQDVHKLRL